MKDLNVYQRINLVHKQITSVTKDNEVSFGNDSYQTISHDAVTAALHLPIAEAGIVVIPNIETYNLESFEKTREWQGKTQTTLWYKADLKVSVTFVNIDNPEDKFSVSCPSYAFDTSDKAIGKAYSMAIKTIMLKTFMLESKDMEEDRKFEGGSFNQKPNYRNVKNYAPTAKK